MSELGDFYEQVGTAAFDNRALGQTGYGLPSVAPNQPKNEQQAIGPVQAWALNGERYWGIAQSQPRLDAGCYHCRMSDGGPYLQVQPLATDTLVRLPDSKSEAIIAEITHFTTLRQAFVSRGLLYKRGVLLWGPPGSGKTSTLHLLMDLIVRQLGGVALLMDHPAVAAECLKLVRKIEPDRQIIGILEDIDGLVASYGVEQYLALLDGENQIDNVVFVATTNYPERLDRRFVDRPSRFDTVEYVGMPSPEARRCYLKHKEPALRDDEIAAMVDVSEGFSVAHLRELIILTQCFGRSLGDAATRLTASRKRKLSSERDPDRQLVGFAS